MQHFGEKGSCRRIHSRIPRIASSFIEKLMRPKRFYAEPPYAYFSGKSNSTCWKAAPSA